MIEEPRQTCPLCKGDGSIPVGENEKRTCPMCKGEKFIPASDPNETEFAKCCRCGGPVQNATEFEIWIQLNDYGDWTAPLKDRKIREIEEQPCIECFNKIVAFVYGKEPKEDVCPHCGYPVEYWDDPAQGMMICNNIACPGRHKDETPKN